MSLGVLRRAQNGRESGTRFGVARRRKMGRALARPARSVCAAGENERRSMCASGGHTLHRLERFAGAVCSRFPGPATLGFRCALAPRFAFPADAQMATAGLGID